MRSHEAIQGCTRRHTNAVLSPLAATMAKQSGKLPGCNSAAVGVQRRGGQSPQKRIRNRLVGTHRLLINDTPSKESSTMLHHSANATNAISGSQRKPAETNAAPDIRDRSRANAAAAIPARYRGVQTRSKFEANWLSAFDQYGWAWEYEPERLGRWFPPDVRIKIRRQGTMVDQFIAELKKEKTTADLAPFERRIYGNIPNCPLPILIFGEVPLIPVTDSRCDFHDGISKTAAISRPRFRCNECGLWKYVQFSDGTIRIVPHCWRMTPLDDSKIFDYWAIALQKRRLYPDDLDSPLMLLPDSG